MSEETCRTCRFWVKQRIHRDSDVAECHRYPPVLNNQSVAARQVDRDKEHGEFAANETAARDACVWALPVTFIDDFCGEWQAKRVPLPVVEDTKSATVRDIERAAGRIVKFIQLNAPDVAISNDLKRITKLVKGFIASRKRPQYKGEAGSHE